MRNFEDIFSEPISILECEFSLQGPSRLHSRRNINSPLNLRVSDSPPKANGKRYHNIQCTPPAVGQNSRDVHENYQVFGRNFIRSPITPAESHKSIAAVPIEHRNPLVGVYESRPK